MTAFIILAAVAAVGVWVYNKHSEWIGLAAKEVADAVNPKDPPAAA